MSSQEHVRPTSSLDPVIQKNLRALLRKRREEEKEQPVSVRISEVVTRLSGSMGFVVVHAAILVVWFVGNTARIPGVRPWDPYPFVMLAMAASVEAIFLSTFILITQNRQAALADRRAELDLQIGLLTEHEVTRLIQMVERLVERAGIAKDEWRDLDELKREVAPERVLSEIEKELTE